MLVQLCVILRMVMNEGNQLSLDKYKIIPCEETRELNDNMLAEPNERVESFLKPELNYLWTQNPLTHMLLPRPDEFWSRPATFRKPAFSLTKLSKSLQHDFLPSFRKLDFEFEKRNKPITLVAFRNPKNGAEVKDTQESSNEAKSDEVAVMQSPYNDISIFWKDDKNA